MTITIEHMIKSVEREVSLRENVYPRRIELGKMNEHQAAWEIAVMKEVLRVLTELKLEKQPDFFMGKGKK